MICSTDTQLPGRTATTTTVHERTWSIVLMDPCRPVDWQLSCSRLLPVRSYMSQKQPPASQCRKLLQSSCKRVTNCPQKKQVSLRYQVQRHLVRTYLIVCQQSIPSAAHAEPLVCQVQFPLANCPLPSASISTLSPAPTDLPHASITKASFTLMHAMVSTPLACGQIQRAKHM